MSILGRHISSTRLIRTYNASTVLQTLYKHGSCSRSQLTKLTGMSPATITRIVTELMEQSIVLEGRMGESTGGRRPVFLHIDYTKLYVASVKLLHDDCRVALLDSRGTIIKQETLVPKSFEPKNLLADVVNSFNTLLARCNINREHLLGVGVAISGVCHPNEGIVIKSANLNWQDVAVADLLNEDLGLPIFIENDANASALAELWFGQAKNSKNSMYIKTETGAGVGIVLGGNLLTGPRFITGEIGHVPIIVDGQPCRCGQRGCLQPYVYFADIRTRYGRENGDELSPDRFITLVRQKDAKAMQIVEETAKTLAFACAHWGVLLDMDVITIGGIWGKLKKEIIDYCQEYYNNVLKRTGISSNITISGSSFDNETDLLGAAGLVIDRWLTPYSAPLAASLLP